MKKDKKRPLTAKLRVKNGRYYAVFNCKQKDGKTKEIWRTLDLESKPGNKRIAINKMEEMKYQYKGIMDVPGFDVLFLDYLNNWKNRKEGEVEESTFKNITRYTEKTIANFFTPLNLYLSEVKPLHIHQFYEYLYKSGRANGTDGLSISSIKAIKSILNEVFKTAIVEELVHNNPVESVKLPVKDNPRKPHTVLDKDSANRLLGFVEADELMFPLLLTTLRYGLRRSEVLGLKWGAIDYHKNTIRIESVITCESTPEKNRTKTATSNASFPLLPDIKDALEIRKAAQERNRSILGDSYIENDYVFTYDNGDYLKPDWLTKQFKRIIAQCGLPDMRFHDLRHSTACILYSKGMGIKELQHWMRHGKIEMTADVYLHISKERELEMANGLQNLFSVASKPESIPKRITKLA